jgi:O-antigen/teichoic acid export membrane protein
LAVGNSIAAVVLPEMVRRDTHSRDDAVQLWRKTTVVNTMLLLPAAIFLARFADPIITTAFKADYRPAVPVLQIHMLFLVRACVDFAPALRAINKTRPLVYSNVAALMTNTLVLILVMPRAGITGAVAALVISGYVEGAVLGWWTVRLYGIPARELLPIAGMSKVLLAALAGAAVVALPIWSNVRLTGVVLAACCFYAVVVCMIAVLKLDEARILWGRLRNFGMAMRTSSP